MESDDWMTGTDDADESRNLKPYALPVRVLLYASMTDARLRVRRGAANCYG